MLFPAIASITGEKRVMERNVEQHRAFTPGFEKFVIYVKDCVKVDEIMEKYDAKEFQRLIDSFGGELVTHLKQEIETLLALEKYDITALRKEYEKWDIVQQKFDKVCFIQPFQDKGRMMVKKVLNDNLHSQYCSRWFLEPVMTALKAVIRGLMCLFSCHIWWSFGLRESIEMYGDSALLRLGPRRGGFFLDRMSSK